MKIKNGLLVIALLIGLSSLNAQDVTTVEATDSNVGENLDLEAVASVFGEAKDLEDFEKKLNDPDTQISNLDLNKDNEVDYLRVIESSKGDSRKVTIQAVIGKDKYQDVATINVEEGEDSQVEVVGDVSMYDSSYVIYPVYVHPPVIVIWFWGPGYNPWRSPYYWGYYPPYYRPWRPYPTSRYRKNVHVHVNVNNSYNRTNVNVGNSKKDVADKKNPEKTNKEVKSTGKEVQDDWKTDAEKKGKKSNVKDNKTSVPSNKTNPKPVNKPTNKPTSKPASKPKGKRKN